MKSPKILIPLATLKEHEDNPLKTFGVRETYLKKVQMIGAIPVFVTPHFTDAQLWSVYDGTDGILLLGGTDVSPALYGSAAHPRTVADDPMRDELEIKIVRKAFGDRRPILGICRGCQVLAVALGGTLIQHIPDLVREENHSVSRYCDLLGGPTHAMILEENSNVSKILGGLREVSVNSAHHQSVDHPGSYFRIVGRSPEGIVEAIEVSVPDYFCIGLQSHPEAQGENPMDKFFFSFRDSLLNTRNL